MTTEKMTVHQALAELKTMDDRINKAMDMTYAIAVKHSAEKINGVSIKDFKDQIVSNYQKVEDLMKRRDAMKRAVVLSNSNTKVTVAGKEMSVAEAIETKQHGVEYKKMLLSRMNKSYRDAQYILNTNNAEAVEKKAEQYVLSVIAAQPKDSKMSVDSDAMKNLRAEYIKNNSYDLIDPLDVVAAMEKLTDEINQFETAIDAALSVSNALTVIEFEY